MGTALRPSRPPGATTPASVAASEEPRTRCRAPAGARPPRGPDTDRVPDTARDTDREEST
jgi:hypothetical protein